MRGSLELRELSARKFFSKLLDSFLIYFEIFESKTAARMGIYLTALERTDTVGRYIIEHRRKRDAPTLRAPDSTELKHYVFKFVFFIYIYSVIGYYVPRHTMRVIA